MVVSYDSRQEDVEVIRMSQWAEVRHMHLVDGVPKQQIGQRLGMDVTTVRGVVVLSNPEMSLKRIDEPDMSGSRVNRPE